MAKKMTEKAEKVDKDDVKAKGGKKKKKKKK